MKAPYMFPKKQKRTKKQVVGLLGEDISARFLEEKGYSVVCRNYRKKYGEIDIIARRKDKIYFIEVKTVSRDNLADKVSDSADLARPEDNVHPDKLKRLSRTIQAYLAENSMGEEDEWQFDVITVLLDVKNKIARVKRLEDIIL